ncbi:helix-turn-helix domain-containing protein [Paenibacillus sp. 1P07SE]|uniref:helix-turn-helix domain-containing protein n=1 Tax=Paenibacillus sp. 1P07SE TaxID=3132209 RepID=UPI0039A73B2C
MNQNWFTRMLMLYMPVFLIVPAFLFFVFFQHLSEVNHKNAERANQFLAEQAQLMIDSSLSMLDQKITLEMLRNQSVLRYFSDSDISDLTLQVYVMNLLQELKLTNPLIHSIYMVRSVDGSVLNVSTAYPAGQYADSDFIADKLARPNSNWSDVRLYKELESDHGAHVVTMTRSVTIFSSKLGMIVVNVSTEALYSLVQQMYNPDVSRLQLYDRQNIPMFGNSQVTLESAAGDEPSNLIQSVAVSSYTGWKAESGIQNARAVSFMLSLSNVWFVLGFVLVVLSIVWMVYVTRQNYRPIRNLVDELQRLSPADRDDISNTEPPVYKNEFSFIDSTLKRMIGQNTSFQEQLTKDLGVKRNFFLHELLEGTRSIDLDSWEEEADRYGLPRSFGRQQVFILEIDRWSQWSKDMSLERQAEHKQRLETVLAERLQRSGYGVWMLWISVNQLAVIVIGQETLAEPGGEMVQLMEECRSEAHRGLSGQATCTIGLGESVEHPDNLRDSYQEALEALQYKAVDGGGSVIAYTDAPQIQEHVYAYFQKIDSLVDAFKRAESRWLTELEDLFAELEDHRVSRRGLDSVLKYLLFYMDKAVGGMHPDYVEEWQEQILPGLNGALKEAEWIRDTAEAFVELLGRYAGMINTKRESKTQGSMMKEMKAYIEQHFTNPELSLDFLQEKFGVSGKYLSRLFKEEYGVKFVDFLIELRMEEGKRLLAETSFTVQEITERLGYSSPISFARSFKKVVGMAPADYRKSVQSS